MEGGGKSAVAPLPLSLSLSLSLSVYATNGLDSCKSELCEVRKRVRTTRVERYDQRAALERGARLN